MRIDRIEVTPVGVPMSAHRTWDPHGGAWQLPVIVVRVFSEDGHVGVGHTLSVMPEFGKSLTVLVGEVAGLVIGVDPTRPQSVVDAAVGRDCWIGPGGALHLAAAALDIALWDLRATALGQPLWKLLGGARDVVPVYDSGSLMSDDVRELQAAAAASVARGHRAMKMRPGPERHGRIASVAARVAAIRDVVGPDVDLMYDVNQTWRADRATRAIAALDEFDLRWIEDPVSADDVVGQASVRARANTPIAAGEYVYSLSALVMMLERRSVDVLMIDLLRQGGITQFMKAAATAESFGVPVVSHIIPEVYAHCIAAIPNGLYVEDLDWSSPIYAERHAVREGTYFLGDAPGIGLRLDDDYIAAHALAAPEIITP